MSTKKSSQCSSQCWINQATREDWYQFIRDKKAYRFTFSSIQYPPLSVTTTHRKLPWLSLWLLRWCESKDKGGQTAESDRPFNYYEPIRIIATWSRKIAFTYLRIPRPRQTTRQNPPSFPFSSEYSFTSSASSSPSIFLQLLSHFFSVSVMK